MQTKRSSADLLEEAKAMTPRNQDGSFDKAQLQANLATLIVIDSEKRRAAKEIIDGQCAVEQGNPMTARQVFYQLVRWVNSVHSNS